MVDPIDTVFAALANPTRRELLRLLRNEGQQPVQQLANHFTMQRPSTLRASEGAPRCRVSQRTQAGTAALLLPRWSYASSDSRVVSALRAVLERPYWQPGSVTCRGEQ